MQTPFERLAAVLDNASANYLSESQRQQQLADERAYAQRQLTEARTYEETMAEKERARAQEKALIAAGYLSKPLGQNSAEDILAATAKAAQHALAVTEAGDAERKDAAARRDHEAAKRNREAEEWKLNPVKSQERIAMEKVVDGGMLDFGKPAAKMTDEELTDAFTKTRADNIKRDAVGDDYANRIQSEFLKADAASDPTPTIDEIKRARAANSPKSSSMADRQMAEEAAQQMAASIAAQRAAFAMKDRDAIRYLMSDVLKKGHYPTAPAALGTPVRAVSTEQALGDFFGDLDAQSTTMGKAPAALGLDEEVARGRITEEVDKAWPEIESDYTLAALGDDAIREQINAPITRTRLKPRSTLGLMAASPYDPNPAYEQEAYEDRPNAAEVDSRLLVLRDKQKAARGRLAKRRSQFEQYVPKTADAEQMRRAQIAKAILGLTKTEEAIKKNAFESTAATLAQQ